MLQEAGPSTSAEAVGKGRGRKWKELPGVENITPTSLKIKLPKNTFNLFFGFIRRSCYPGSIFHVKHNISF